MAKIITIYWRDIPSQIVVKEGRVSRKTRLPSRFQAAVDRAAMRAGKGSSQFYLSDWRRESRACEGDPGAAVAAELARIEASYSDERLERLVKSGGLGRDPQ
jgi:hypothetical protein